MSVIRMECYVPKNGDGTKIYDPDSISLHRDFVYTIRELTLENLEVSDIKKYAGSMFNPSWVIAVFDVKSKDPTPFFIKENDVKKLKAIIKKIRSKQEKVEIPLYIP